MFHDAPVSQFGVLANELHLHIDEFSTAPGEKMLPARITITGFSNIYRDCGKAEAFQIESDSAEVYELKSSIEGVELTLMWHHWNSKLPDVFATYLFRGANVLIEALAGGPSILVPDLLGS